MEIIIAIIGSGALSAVVSAIVASRKFERPYEKLSTLQSELTLVGTLQGAADPTSKEGAEAQNRSRAAALTYVARAQVNARIAESIVPRRSLLNTAIILFGVLCMLAGASMIVGAFISGSVTEFLLPGTSVLIAGIFAAGLGGVSERFEGKARMSLIRALDNPGGAIDASDPSNDGVWLSGQRPNFNWLEKQIMPADTRVLLSDALESIGAATDDDSSATSGPALAEFSIDEPTE